MEQYNLFGMNQVELLDNGLIDSDENESQSAKSLLTQLLENSRLYTTTRDFRELLDFISRLRNFAPFNAMLLQIQKPGLMYAASAHDWMMRFNRTIKEGARPLLILWPFAPVALVYDLNDTEGEAPLPEDISQSFRATGPITSAIIESFITSLNKFKIELKLICYGDGKAGYIIKYTSLNTVDDLHDYQIRVNKDHNANVQFSTLMHELGHLYLGHIGSNKRLKIPDRSSISTSQQEIEAESLSYLICARNNVKPKSESYLLNHIESDKDLPKLDIYTILKAAGQIERIINLDAHTKFGM